MNNHHKRYLQTRHKDDVLKEVEAVGATMRRSRNAQDPADCYVIEGPARLAKKINAIVYKWDEGGKP